MSLLTPRDVAERCGLCYRAVLRAIEDGELPAYRIRNQLRVSPEDYEQWLESSRVVPRPELAEVPTTKNKVVGSLS